MESFDTSDPFFNEYALGVLVRVSDARYKSFARPGDVLTAKVELVERVESLFEFRSTLRIADRTIMRNNFQLTNIPSRVLQGTTP
jgi:3-hydroxyacyl-[acyl-carrier-protein] dehydratase